MSASASHLDNRALYCNETKKSEYYVVKLRGTCAGEKDVSACIKNSVDYKESDELNLFNRESEKLYNKESDTCNCLQQSACNAVALNASYSFKSQKLSEENNVSICKCHESDKSGSSADNQSSKDDSVFTFETQSLCHDDPDEITLARTTSTGSSDDSVFRCTCGHISTCYNMEESKALLDQLLNQLPKTGYADESQKYWEMMLHCERAAFPREVSNLPLPSREARFYWHLYSSAAKHSTLYQKEVNHAFRITLAKLIHSQKTKKGISIWEQLVRLKTLDPVNRKNLINNLVRFFCIQSNLESICLEGLSLTPNEGVRLMTALYNSRKTMRHVYCWRAFEKMVNISENSHHRDESRFYKDKIIKKYDWFCAIGNLKFLTTLSVNYAYIATSTGDLLILLAKRLGSNWHWLQFLCLEEEIMHKYNGDKFIKNTIPDTAWKKTNLLAPELKVQYAIIGISKYDIHKWFFTKHTPTHTFALSTSVDIRFQQPWYLNCTFKTLYSWYSNTLVYLCMQLWHNRENLDNQLKKLFINLPSLRVFEFTGEIRELKTLCTMCLQIRSCTCNVHIVNMQLQQVVHDNIDKETWMKTIKCLMVCFKSDFEQMGVKFNIDFHCW